MTLQHITSCRLPTEHGIYQMHGYQDSQTGQEHIALVMGDIADGKPVLSRIHSARGDGPDLVHVDAYRMADADELADIDLDATLSRSVTLVEWGEGIAEWLSDERLEIDIDRDVGDEARRVILTGIGPRWDGVLETIRRKP